LAQIVAGCLPRPKPGQSNPATRSFQGLRIAVNAEFDALIDGLEAAERALKPGGKLAVVSFHSLEDRVVKRFLAQRAGQGGGGNRFLPEAPQTTARFTLIEKKGVSADSAELAANPRARSARLRMAIRTDAAPGPSDRSALGLPRISEV
jgi:16S rRNA (cytosine1402-N4)-methyltransferase